MISQSSRWPARILGRAPTLVLINVVCWGLFVVLLVMPFYSVVHGRDQQRRLLRTFDADFVYFYTMGRLLNEHPADRLYDYELQKGISDEVHPLTEGFHAPIPYPPYVGIFFQMFARLPYVTAYLLWLSVSLLLYLGGLTIIATRFLSRDPLHLSLIYCLALSFRPFANDLMINGHLSAIGFCAVTLAIREEDRGRPMLSGLALSACLYKPTLVVLLLPMLFVTRRLSAILGFAAGGAALVLFTTVLKGPSVWPGFFRMLRDFAAASAGSNARSFLRLGTYVDLTSFSSLLPGGRSRLGAAILVGCFCWVAFALAKVWWKSRAAGKPTIILVWAITLTWTLVVNVYVPMYDTILVVLSLIMTAGVLKDLRNESLNRWFTRLWLALMASYWISEKVANAIGIQIVTILLSAIGMFQFAAFRQMDKLYKNPTPLSEPSDRV